MSDTKPPEGFIPSVNQDAHWRYVAVVLFGALVGGGGGELLDGMQADAPLPAVCNPEWVQEVNGQLAAMAQDMAAVRGELRELVGELRGAGIYRGGRSGPGG